MVTSIGGVSTGDAVSSVTQTVKTGAVLGSGTAITASSTPIRLTTVVAPGDINSVPSSATGTGLSNYNITYTGNTYTINKANLSITASNDTKVYGATTSSNGISYSGLGVASASGGVGYSITAGQLMALS